MGFFEFLHDCVDFLKDAWNRFTDWLGSLVEKVINSIENWLSSIINSFTEGFILITNGLINWVISKNKAQKIADKLEKNYSLREITSEQLLAQLKANAESQHEVSTTSQEQMRWQENVGSQEKMYTT